MREKLLRIRWTFAGLFAPDLLEYTKELQRDLWRANKATSLAQRQLDAVDRELPPWESAPGECCVGRVQTIRNLIADRTNVQSS